MINKIILSCFLLLSAISSSVLAQVSPDQEWQIKAEIKQLADNYGFYRDHFMTEEYLTIWAEDAIAIDGDRMWQGHEELRTRIPDPSTASHIMHVMGTSHIDIIDATNATGVHYATIFRAIPEDRPREQSTILEMDGVYLVAKYMDEYILTDDGWKISKRDIDRTFRYTKD